MRISESLRRAAPPEKAPRLKGGIRLKTNAELHKATGIGYHRSIPWDAVVKILDKHGIVPLQEDNTEFAGFFTGAKGQVRIDVAPKDSAYEEHGATFYTPFENSVLSMSWYRVDSGAYEVVLYLS